MLGFPLKLFEVWEGTEFFEVLQFGSVYGYMNSGIVDNDFIPPDFGSGDEDPDPEEPEE